MLFPPALFNQTVGLLTMSLRLFRCESAVKLCGSVKRTAGLGPLRGNHMQKVTTTAHCGSTQLNTTI